MDDLLCTGDTWESHMRNVKVMFQTLQDNNLTCNPSKCEFGFSNVEYLGLVIGSNGIQISPRKLKAIKKVPVPTNRKSLQRLFGLMNFYRRFIKDFSQRTGHMRKLLIKDEPFVWSDECQKELDYPKNCLMSGPILQPFDLNQDLVIITDAAQKVGYGWQLMQLGQDNKLHPVSYGSQAVTKAQTNWTAAQLELSALALALRQYESFAVHKQVTVLTDNSRVLHVDKRRCVNARERRLITYLMQFRLRIKYIRGCNNASADYLSRMYQDMSEEDRAQFSTTCSDVRGLGVLLY